MTLGGAVFMALSWALVLGLTFFCFHRLFGGGGDESR